MDANVISRLAILASHQVPQYPLLVAVPIFDDDYSGITLVGEQSSLRFDDELFLPLMAHQIDKMNGHNSTTLLCKNLPDGIEEDTFLFLLKILTSHKLVTENYSNSQIDSMGLMAVLQAGFEKYPLQKNPLNGIKIIFFSAYSLSEIGSELRKLGAIVSEMQKHGNRSNEFSTTQVPDLVIAVDNYLPWPNAHDAHEHFFHAGVPILFVQIDSRGLILGPTVIKESTACLECYKLRRASCTAHPKAFSIATNLNSLSDALCNSPPPLNHAAQSAIGIEVLRILLALSPTTISTSLKFDFFKPDISRHFVLKNPKCKMCLRS